MNYASPNLGSRKMSLVRVGGALGIASNFIGLAIFLGACHGFSAALALSFIPLLLSLPGLVLTIIGGVTQPHDPNVEDTHTLASIFINIAGIAGAAVEMAAWYGNPLFGSTGGM